MWWTFVTEAYLGNGLENPFHDLKTLTSHLLVALSSYIKHNHEHDL